MKPLLAALALLAAHVTHAAPPTTATELGRYLSANAAVKGAVAEAKRYAEAATCGAPRVVEMELDTFRATVECARPGKTPGPVLDDGAAVRVDVSGSFFNGGSGVLIERIEFHYEG